VFFFYTHYNPHEGILRSVRAPAAAPSGAT